MQMGLRHFLRRSARDLPAARHLIIYEQGSLIRPIRGFVTTAYVTAPRLGIPYETQYWRLHDVGRFTIPPITAAFRVIEQRERPVT